MKYKILNEGVSNDFNYSGVEYDYDGKDCTDPNCGCRHDDYCRRNFYVNLHIENISINGVRTHFLEKSLKKKGVIETKDDSFVEYCVDRLLRIHKVYLEDNWEINTGRGYYGDEVESITLGDFGDLRDKVKHIINLHPDDRIEAILLEEYGHLIPAVKDRKWEQISVPTSLLVCGNEDYRKKVDGEIYKEWDTPELAIGIYVTDNGRYKLIDGYHRYVELVCKQKLQEVTIIRGV